MEAPVRSSGWTLRILVPSFLVLLAVFALSPGREPSAGEAAGLFVPGKGAFSPAVLLANWASLLRGAAVFSLAAAAAAGAGRLACAFSSPGTGGALSWLAGTPVLSLALLGLGLAGLWFPPLVLGTAAAFLLPLARGRGGKAAGIWKAAWPCLLVLPAVLAPETAFDSLRYHLALPAGWLSAHRVSHVPRLLFSNFPSGTEMLYGLCLAAGSEAAAKLLNWSFLAASSLLLFSRARGPLGAGLALGLASAVCASPFFGRMAGFCNADLGLMALTFGGLLAALEGRFLLAGLLFGGACGVKYLGAFALAPGAVALLLARSRPGTFLLRSGLPALAVFLPWGLRNLLETGNPLQPYLLGGYDLEPATVTRHLQYAADWRHAHPFWSAWLTQYPAVVARGVYEGTAETLSPVLMSAPAVAAVLAARGPSLPALPRACGLFAALYWVVWAFAGGGVVRFLLPAVFPAGVYLAHALGRLALPRRALAAGLLAAGLLAAGLLAALAVQLPFLFAAQRRFSDPAGFLLGFESRRNYLDRVLEPHGRRLTAMERACASLSPGKVLMLGDPQAFHSPCPALTEFEFAPPLLVRLAADSPTPGRLRLRLKQRGIAGFLYRAEGMVSVARMYGLDAPPGAFGRLAEFWSAYAEPLWTFEEPNANNFYHCYALRERPGRFVPPKTLLWFNLPGTEEVTNRVEHLLDAREFREARALALAAVGRYPDLPTAWHRLWLAARGAHDAPGTARAAAAVRRTGYGALLKP